MLLELSDPEVLQLTMIKTVQMQRTEKCCNSLLMPRNMYISMEWTSRRYLLKSDSYNRNGLIILWMLHTQMSFKPRFLNADSQQSPAFIFRIIIGRYIDVEQAQILIGIQSELLWMCVCVWCYNSLHFIVVIHSELG